MNATGYIIDAEISPPRMTPAGFILTGIRKYRSRAHPPMILAHSLTTQWFGIDERAGDYPDFENFAVWPATQRLLWALRKIDRPELAGQSSVAHFGHWQDPASRKIILCTRQEAKRARFEAKLLKT
jgi:hypothetical protein